MKTSGEYKTSMSGAMAFNLDLGYNVASFMRDIQEIRAETFKKKTIHSAFRKAGIWPISCKTAIEKINIYALPEPEPELSTIPRTPTKFVRAEHCLSYWKEKIRPKLSSLSQGPFDSWTRGTERVLACGELTVLQHNVLATKVRNQQKAKSRNRDVLQKHSVMTAEEAWAKKGANVIKQKALLDKKRAFLTRVTRNKIKSNLKSSWSHSTLGTAAHKRIFAGWLDLSYHN